MRQTQGCCCDKSGQPDSVVLHTIWDKNPRVRLWWLRVQALGSPGRPAVSFRYLCSAVRTTSPGVAYAAPLGTSVARVTVHTPDRWIFRGMGRKIQEKTVNHNKIGHLQYIFWLRNGCPPLNRHSESPFLAVSK